MFGMLEHYRKEYIFSIFLSNGQRDHIMCHYGARYSAELEGQLLSAEIRISEYNRTYLSRVEPVGRERQSHYKNILSSHKGCNYAL